MVHNIPWQGAGQLSHWLFMKRVVVLTGAGISAESGIPTFRGEDGLWEGHPLEDVATPEGFQRNPVLVHEFYNSRRRALKKVKENAAHLALARFEERQAKREGCHFLLVTQNIDNLHERAGTQNILHMHGELFKKRCLYCGKISEIRGDLSLESLCEDCNRPGGLRPHVVWFGEIPLGMEQIYAALQEADLFVSIGTSGHVYPAAGFVQAAREAKARCVELNLEASQTRQAFDVLHQGPATVLVPSFFDKLCSSIPMPG